MDSSQLAKLATQPAMLLVRDFCTGYPYLTLRDGDYALQHSLSVYDDYVRLIKKLGYENKWDSGRTTFFEVHPIFADGQPISGLMGLHLSLSLFDRDIAGRAQTLYFDTPSNVQSQTSVTDKNIYSSASWLQLSVTDVFGDCDVEEENPFVYLKASINLVKVNDLVSLNITPPTIFSGKLFDYYAGLEEVESRTSNIREIIKRELNDYATYNDSFLRESAALRTSSLYLFLVLFHREFGLDIANFRNSVSENKLKFDFIDASDINDHTQLALQQIDRIRLRIGEYLPDQLNYSQSPVLDENSLSVEAVNRATLAPVEVADGAANQVSNLVESKVDYVVKQTSRFYSMVDAHDSESCIREIYDTWRALAFRFNVGDAYIYNILRSTVTDFVAPAADAYHLSEYKNRAPQLHALRAASFDVFMRTLSELNRMIVAQILPPSATTQKSSISKQDTLFSLLDLPPQTPEQIRERTALSPQGQQQYDEKIVNDHRAKFHTAISGFMGKLSHPTNRPIMGQRLSSLDALMLRQMIYEWYHSNYLNLYLSTTTKYTDILDTIKQDSLSFTEQPQIRLGIVSELRTFLRVKYNPYLILDLSYLHT